jgi:very-short-patch-repair endonuclease
MEKELCSYGCGNIATIQFKNGKFCCSDSKNKCSVLRKKNSNGTAKNGGAWNKGLTKLTDKRVKKYGESGKIKRKQLFKEKKIVIWNKGLTKETDQRVYDNTKNLSKNRRGYYHRLQYFIDKYGKEAGTQKYYELNKKKVLSLENFIKKYGIREGEKRFEKWLKVHINFYSKKSQLLFWNLFYKLSDDRKEHLHFAELNKEFGKNFDNKYFFYDFVDTKTKKVIEFNGDRFHANPELYKESDKPNFYADLTSKEIWDLDKHKIGLIEKLGFKVLVIWEKEFDESLENTINKCYSFLN